MAAAEDGDVFEGVEAVNFYPRANFISFFLFL